MLTTFLRTPLVACVASVAFTVGCGQERSGGARGVPDVSTAERSCLVTFAIVGTGEVEELDVEVDHGAAGGDFVDDGRQIECESFVPGALVSATDDSPCYGSGDSRCGPDVAFLGVLAPPGLLSAPRELMRCKWVGERQPALEHFEFEYAWYWPRDPRVEVAVTDVHCSLADDTPASTTTSSTMPPACSQPCVVGEECVEGRCVGPNDYDVTFSVAEELTLGGIDFNVLHECDLGAFVGRGELVDCTMAPHNAMASFNNLAADPSTCDPRADRLAVAIMSIAGIDTPADLFTCRFRALERAPRAGDFRFALHDALDPDVVTILPLPEPGVARIRKISP